MDQSYLEELNEDELIDLANEFGIEISPDMLEEEIIQKITQAQSTNVPQKNKPKKVENKKSDEMLLLRYVGKGGTFTNATGKWTGHTQKLIEKKIAKEMVQKFPSRFRVINT